MKLPLRVIVIDDSATYRKIVSDSIADIPQIELVGTAKSALHAIEAIKSLQPDVVTLDWEMPGGGGPEVLHYVKQDNRCLGAIVLSGCEDRQVRNTAMELGAFDFVHKPDAKDPSQNATLLRRSLAANFAAYISYLEMIGELSVPDRVATATSTSSTTGIGSTQHGQHSATKPELVVIGASTGGPESLHTVLTGLPADLALPVVIAQHMPAGFTHDFAQELDRCCKLHVVEGVDGQALLPGNVVIAPGGMQTSVARKVTGLVLRVTAGNGGVDCCPSVDQLFESASESCGSGALAVIMTGMGHDGTQGCRHLKHKGATIIAQNQQSCVVFGMPAQPIAEGLADSIVPLNEIAWEITHYAGHLE